MWLFPRSLIERPTQMTNRKHEHGLGFKML